MASLLDETNLDTDLLALQFLNRFDVGFADDDIVAVRIIGQHDHHAFGAIASHHEGIAVGHGDGIELARRKGVHRGRIVEPLEAHVEAGWLESIFVDGHLPRNPARPIAMANLQRIRGRGSGRQRKEQRKGRNGEQGSRRKTADHGQNKSRH
jgi:hypothetical protein